MYQSNATCNINYWVMPIRTKRELTAMDIIDATCRAFNIQKILLLSECRQRELVRARDICMYVMQLKIKDRGKQISLINIGRSMGGRDHTTVMHSIKKIENDLTVIAYRQETNEQIKSVIELL